MRFIALDQAGRSELPIKQMLSFEARDDGEYKLALILAEEEALFLLEDLDCSVFDEIGEEFGVMLAVEPRHELVDVERYHVLDVVPEQLAHVLRDLLDLAPLFDKVDVDDSVLGIEGIVVGFVEYSLLDHLLLRVNAELLLPRSVHFQKLEEHKDHHLDPIVVGVLQDQQLKHSIDMLFAAE